MRPLKKIVIVGGGSAGWIAAAMLAHHLKAEVCSIELLSSDDLGNIGIGESTIPPLLRLIQSLGIDERDFIKNTQACFKLGIKFVDWRQKNQSYFHPFGVLGMPIGSHDFYQCWLKARQQGHDCALQDFSPCSVMAAQGKFFWPAQLQNTPVGGASYAVHLDANLVVDYLQKFAQERGVSASNGKVADLSRGVNGPIEKLILQDGREIHGDFFIDCTGFKALLIGQHLGVGFEDWSRYLPCDRALVLKTAPTAERAPYTIARAHSCGWSWQIPLRQSTGHGYVYSSQFGTEAEAKSRLFRQLRSPRTSAPRSIAFTNGRRTAIWEKNCLALGLAAGFVEPLEATAIQFIVRGMDLFLRLFPDRDCEPCLIKEYNRRMAANFAEVRDFIVLHYCTSQRDDSEFWRWCRSMPLPESLQERMELFKAHGLVSEGADDLFRPSSWQSVFEGMGVRPQKYSPRVDNLNYEDIARHLNDARKAIASMVKNLPSHEDFLSQYCPHFSQ